MVTGPMDGVAGTAGESLLSEQAVSNTSSSRDKCSGLQNTFTRESPMSDGGKYRARGLATEREGIFMKCRLIPCHAFQSLYILKAE